MSLKKLSYSLFVICAFAGISCTGNDPTIVITSPRDEARYPTETDSILIKAVITDYRRGIQEYSYELDDTIFEQFEYNLTNTARLEVLVKIPEPAIGRHTLTVRAENGTGDRNYRTVEFRVLAEDIELTEFRWDGGGDGINWSDPENWEGDRLPNETDLVIVDLEGTERILLADNNGTVYKAGALDIDADLILENRAKLELNASNESSFITGVLQFKTESFGLNGPILQFGPFTEGARLTVQDTLYMGGAHFTSVAETRLESNYIISSSLAYDSQDGPSGLQQVGRIYNGVKLVFQREAQFRRFFTWEMNGMAAGPNGQTEIINKGVWTMDGTIFTQINDIENITVRITNEGEVQIRRTEVNNFVQVDGAFLISNLRTASWTDSMASPGLTPSIFEYNYITDSDLNTFPVNLRNISTDAEIVIGAGNVAISNLHTPKLTINHSFSGGQGKKSRVVMEGNRSMIDLVNVEEGFLRIPDGVDSVNAVVLRRRGTLSARNTLIDSLVINGTDAVFNFSGTLQTRYIKWDNGTNNSSGNSTLEILPHPQDIYSVFAPGRSFGIEDHFYDNNTIIRGKLNWQYGNLVRRPRYNSTTFQWLERIGLMQIKAGGEFYIDGGFDVELYPPDTLGQKRMNVEVEGTLRNGFGQATTIWGCVYLIGEGRLIDPNGGLAILENGWNCQEDTP